MIAPSSPHQQAAEERITLTDFESSTIIGAQRGITTITFLRGKAYPAAGFIRERLRAITEVNPWIAGRLVQDTNEKNLQFVYPSTSTQTGTATINDSTLDDLVRLDPPNLSIHSKMEYIALREAIVESEAQLPKGRGLVNKPDLVFRVTIAPDSIDKSAAFAIVFSMSHAIGDAHTYYAIIKMISEGTNIIALNPTRSTEVAMRCTDACKDAATYLSSFASLFSVFWKIVFKPKNKYCAYYVDKARVEAAKNSAKARGAKFVSTNDILTSTFRALCNARLCFMVINLRNRVKGATYNNAGNFLCGLPLDLDVYKHPEGIRRVIQKGLPFVAHTRPFPGFF